jgi:hypothetical protein
MLCRETLLEKVDKGRKGRSGGLREQGQLVTVQVHQRTLLRRSH